MSVAADPTFITRPIVAADAVIGFASGEQDLDNFFAKYAYSNGEQGLGVTYVLLRRPTDDSVLPYILGFYTISMATIASKQASKVIVGKLPRYPIPAALIGRLAVDHRAQGRGLGSTLLVDAFGRILGASDGIGCAGIVVDAKNGNAEAFYLKYGFVAVDAAVWPRRMFIAIGTVRQSLELPSGRD